MTDRPQKPPALEASEIVKDRLIDLAHCTFGPASAAKMQAILAPVPDRRGPRKP